jgi:GR25 family glycosyltransferase involved in LPS biosynthesis
MKIDKIYVLALNPDQDRVNDIKIRLKEAEFEGTTGFEILFGHDGWNEPVPDWVTIYDGWKLDTKNPFWKLPVQPGEIGCTISHINAWKRVAEGDEEVVLILEEDFLPEKRMLDLPEPNANGDWPFTWDYLTLGRWVFKPENDISIDDTFCIPSKHYNMQAYILTKLGAQKLVDYKLEDNLFINDEFIMATYMQHSRADLNEMYPVKTINAIATKKDWFNQDGSSNKVSSHAPQQVPDSRNK